MRVFFLGLAILVGLIVLTAGRQPAAAQNTDTGLSSVPNREVIRRYTVDVDVRQSGVLEVTERIEIYAAGRLVRRGIYRDFPTTYYRWYGAIRVPFKVLSITRNGQAEPWRTVSRSNGVRVFIGNAERNVPTGWQTYVLRYRTDRQLGHLRNRDELYWNAIGTGWLFPIQNVLVTVKLPSGADISEARAFTGVRGSRASAGAVESTTGGVARFRLNETLPPGKGLTIVVQWQKGLVTVPDSSGQVWRFLDDNWDLIAAIIGVLVLALFYLIAWLRAGRDPRKGTIIPLYHPPEGFSPAACRFIMRMGFDNKAMVAAVINMAVKGFLTIRETGNGDNYILEKTDDSVGSLSGGEKALASVFFSGKTGKTYVRPSNHAKLRRAIDKLKDALKTEYELGFFQRNRKLHWIGVGIAIFFTLLIAILAPGETGFILLWLALWSFVVLFVIIRMVSAWVGRRIAQALGLSLVAALLLGAEIFVLVVASENSSLLTLGATVIMSGLIILFHHLMKAPTAEGRRVMDEIEGFRLYLSVAEQDRLDLLNPPERTPALFERFLPYALALDVENKWAGQFARIFDGVTQDSSATAYTPVWYTGKQLTGMSLDGFASEIGGSLTGAIASSSTAPGSSSGGGGGGSVGGGGGGGGGGGW